MGRRLLWDRIVLCHDGCHEQRLGFGDLQPFSANVLACCFSGRKWVRKRHQRSLRNQLRHGMQCKFHSRKRRAINGSARRWRCLCRLVRSMFRNDGMFGDLELCQLGNRHIQYRKFKRAAHCYFGGDRDRHCDEFSLWHQLRPDLRREFCKRNGRAVDCDARHRIQVQRVGRRLLGNGRLQRYLERGRFRDSDVRRVQSAVDQSHYFHGAGEPRSRPLLRCVTAVLAR